MPRALSKRVRRLWPLFLAKHEAATVSGLHPNRIEEAVNTGELEAYRVGRRHLIATDDLVAFVKRNFPRV